LKKKTYEEGIIFYDRLIKGERDQLYRFMELVAGFSGKNVADVMYFKDPKKNQPQSPSVNFERVKKMLDDQRTKKTLSSSVVSLLEQSSKPDKAILSQYTTERTVQWTAPFASAVEMALAKL
jgi:hypothetical protein